MFKTPPPSVTGNQPQDAATTPPNQPEVHQTEGNENSEPGATHEEGNTSRASSSGRETVLDRIRSSAKKREAAAKAQQQRQQPPRGAAAALGNGTGAIKKSNPGNKKPASKEETELRSRLPKHEEHLAKLAAKAEEDLLAKTGHPAIRRRLRRHTRSGLLFCWMKLARML